jgi:hypothetical protein
MLNTSLSYPNPTAFAHAHVPESVPVLDFKPDPPRFGRIWGNKETFNRNITKTETNPYYLPNQSTNLNSVEDCDQVIAPRLPRPLPISPLLHWASPMVLPWDFYMSPPPGGKCFRHSSSNQLPWLEEKYPLLHTIWALHLEIKGSEKSVAPWTRRPTPWTRFMSHEPILWSFL